jgi:Ni/Fe-hydrogenase 1 B-type cytochrome subunit
VSALILTHVNVWLDVVFFTLYPIILVALGVHFLGNILTGRAYRRFVKWQWPEHEHPPIKALPKFLHFQHLACIGLLVLSGLYIRFPFFTGGRPFMRGVHYFAMTVVIVNLIWRLWFAYGSRVRDYREFVVNRRDITTMPQVVMYYLFMKPSKPHLGKYNVMQKGTYILFVPMLILQALTGLALLEFWKLPYIGMTPSDLLVGWWLGPMIGSTSLAVAYARIAHYVINWLFIIIVTIHVYLSVSEDFAAFLDFFGLGFLDKRHAQGKAGHATAPGHTPMPAPNAAVDDARGLTGSDLL